MSESGSPKKITIHTGGGCDGNPGPGGWAALLRYGAHVRELAGGEPATTNNRMELQAALSALTALKEACEITIFTDSEYLRQGIRSCPPRFRRQISSSDMLATISFSSGYLPKKCSRV